MHLGYPPVDAIYAQVNLYMENIENNEKVEKSTMQLSYLGERWLFAHGGRSLAHVLVNGKNRPYVLMGLANGGDEKIFIPSDEEIQEYFNDNG